MKKTNNQGFSLVELIIVIAIMAILIGVLAPQYMKYVDKSRVSADKDILDAIYMACTTAYGDPDYAATAPAVSQAGQGFTTVSTAVLSTPYTDTPGTWDEEVINTLGAQIQGPATPGTLENKLKSKAMKGKAIDVQIDEIGNFRVCVPGATDPAAVAAGATFTDYCVPQQY